MTDNDGDCQELLSHLSYDAKYAFLEMYDRLIDAMMHDEPTINFNYRPSKYIIDHRCWRSILPIMMQLLSAILTDNDYFSSYKILPIKGRGKNACIPIKLKV